jgi:hypothetical protein
VSKLTEASRGQDCAFGIYPYCNGGQDRTSPCHLPSEGKGTAIKSPDWWLVDGCDVCHSIIDGRLKTDLPEMEIMMCMFRGLYRTWRRRINDQRLIVILEDLSPPMRRKVLDDLQ